MYNKINGKKGCRISYFNIAFYAAVMGFGGLSITTHKLEMVYNTNTNISHYILFFSIIFFIIVNFLYLLKILLNFDDVRSDFIHPVKSNFFPGIGKIFLIFSIAFLNINIEISKYLWIIGIIWQFIFTVIIFRRWIVKEIDIKDLNPLWFLPIVGNMLAPIVGVKIGFIEISWFLFSIGIIMWIVLFTIIMNRIIFHNPLANKLLPTLIILIAPPSVALMSITALNDGNILDIAKVFYYFGLFMFIIITTKINIFSKLKFYMSWWAYSFPIAVLTSATLLLYSQNKDYYLGILGIILYIILLFIILILVYKTILGIKNKEICIEE
ncbi:MAG: SLAC1 anion channel family protein [Candidatus Gracilibacteria bacterium]|nr:SLAC1 anion channel family protein [Candidatus Gracilibacteria bacterium]